MTTRDGEIQATIREQIRGPELKDHKPKMNVRIQLKQEGDTYKAVKMNVLPETPYATIESVISAIVVERGVFRLLEREFTIPRGFAKDCKVGDWIVLGGKPAPKEKLKIQKYKNTKIIDLG